MRGSHDSQRGRYQFRSPSRAITAGSRMPRTIVASSRTATASPMPTCFIEAIGIVANRANTATITTAALVIAPAVPAIPSATAWRVDSPRS
jgi:hypothetical protein